MAERKRCSSCGQTIAWHSIRGLRAYCNGEGDRTESFSLREIYETKAALGNATARDLRTLRHHEEELARRG